jgi:hypothetical protein
VPRGYPYRRGETGSDRLRQAEWKPSPKTDAEAECEFRYQLEGWTKPYRFIAMRTEKPREEVEDEEGSHGEESEIKIETPSRNRFELQTIVRILPAVGITHSAVRFPAFVIKPGESCVHDRKFTSIAAATVTGWPFF